MNATALRSADGLLVSADRSPDHRAAAAALAAPALAVALLLLHAPAHAAGGADGPTGSALLTDLLGYAAAVLVFVTFYLRSIVHIRIAAVCSNLLFIGYSASAELAPILVLHATLLPLNLWRLRELLAGRQAGGAVPATGFGLGSSRAMLARLRGAWKAGSAGAGAQGMGTGMAALDPALGKGEDRSVAGWLRASAAIGAAVVLIGLMTMPATLAPQAADGAAPAASRTGQPMPGQAAGHGLSATGQHTAAAP
jgi:hypothetical protein